MRVVVHTSDKYLSLVEGCVTLINRLIIPNPEITILCFRTPRYTLPDNCEVVSMGEQKNFGEVWTRPIRPYFESLEDPYFLLLSCDHYILDVDVHRLEECEAFAIKENADKIHLLQWPRTENRDEYNDLFYKHKLGTKWTMETWLDIALWKTHYFNELLKVEDCNYWEFEGHTINLAAKYKPHVIYYKERTQPLFYLDVVRNRKANRPYTTEAYDAQRPIRDYYGRWPRPDDMQIVKDAMEKF